MIGTWRVLARSHGPAQQRSALQARQDHSHQSTPVVANRACDVLVHQSSAGRAVSTGIAAAMMHSLGRAPNICSVEAVVRRRFPRSAARACRLSCRAARLCEGYYVRHELRCFYTMRIQASKKVTANQRSQPYEYVCSSGRAGARI